MGSVPEWYPVVQAARYLGVPPWALEARPDSLYWQLVATASAKAERHAEQVHAKRK